MESDRNPAGTRRLSQTDSSNPPYYFRILSQITLHIPYSSGILGLLLRSVRLLILRCLAFLRGRRRRRWLEAQRLHIEQGRQPERVRLLVLRGELEPAGPLQPRRCRRCRRVHVEQKHAAVQPAVADGAVRADVDRLLQSALVRVNLVAGQEVTGRRDEVVQAAVLGQDEEPALETNVEAAPLHQHPFQKHPQAAETAAMPRQASCQELLHFLPPRIDGPDQPLADPPLHCRRRPQVAAPWEGSAPFTGTGRAFSRILSSGRRLRAVSGGGASTAEDARCAGGGLIFWNDNGGAILGKRDRFVTGGSSA